MKRISLLLWYYFKLKCLYSFHSRAKLEQWQRQKANKFIKRIMQKSKFYKEYYQGFNLKDIDTLPMINKNTMMENFNDLNCVGIDKHHAFEVAFQSEQSRDFTPKIGDITIGLSSGTSGNRGLFLASSKERAIWAGVVLAKTLPKGLFSKERIAFFLRANSNLYETVQSKNIVFQFYDLLDEVQVHISSLNEFQPTILVAPPSMLRILAQHIKDEKLFINPIKIISVAEVLEDIDAKYIKDSFDVNIIHQVYQCTEGFLGVTCEYGTLHLNEDLVYIQKEYLDKECNKFVPIITDFTRTTQPIIRYRLNDILVEKKGKCQCGSCFTAIRSIEGRTDDIFYLKSKDQNEDVPVFPDFFRNAVISASDYIIEYMVRQINYDLLEIHLKLSCDKETVENNIRRNISDLLDKKNTICPEISFVYDWNIEKGKKLKRIERIVL